MGKILNKEQKKAVEHESGPLLIIAGAGTGKTTVITERIKWLIGKKNVDPSEILALTFTEKAAKEMEERVDEVMPLSYSQIWIGTFHGFCDRVLKEDGLHIGIDPGYRLLSEAEAVRILQERIHELGLDYYRPVSNPTKFLYGLVQHFSRLRDEVVGVEDYKKFVEGKYGDGKLSEEDELEKKRLLELVSAYEIYQKVKEELGVMDFADLISNTVELFLKRKNVLEKYKKRFSHVLVDEYQDTNIAQNKLVEMLCPPKSKPNLFVVGDDSQSIYKFRGAAVSNILGFIDKYKETKKVVLTKNYRSSQAILDAAYRLIKHNDPDTLEAKMGISKNLVSEDGRKGVEPEFFFEERVEGEADMVVEKMKEIKEKDGWDWKDFAVLVRANNHAEPFLLEMGREGVPYQFLGPSKLLKQREIKELVSYLQLLVDPVDDVAAFSVLSSHQIGIDQRDLALIRGYAKRQSLSFYEIIKKVINWNWEQKENLRFGQYSSKPPVVSEESKEALKKFLEVFESHLSKIKTESGGQILYFYLRDTDFLDKMMGAESEEMEMIVKNISRLFEKIKSFENGREERGVTELLDWLLMQIELGESPLVGGKEWSQNDAVNVLTVHSAKGLEFKGVFLVNLVDQRFPTRRRSEQIPLPDELVQEMLPEGDPHEQEERRLFYVAITRAKERLFLTGAKFYNEAAKREKKLSIFVKEALGEGVEIKSSAKEEQMSLLGWEKAEEVKELVREKTDGVRINYLSYSQMNGFSICPKQYRYRYILNLPSPPSAAQVLGTAVHQSLKDFYQGVKTRVMEGKEEELLEALKKTWQSVGFDNKDHEKDTYKKAEGMLSAFYKKDFSEEKMSKVLVLEQPFSIRLSPDLRIGGVIDRVDDIGNREVEIIDYKTGGKVPSQNDMDKNEQLTMYALAASDESNRSWWSRPTDKMKLSLWFLDSKEKVSTTRTAEEVLEMRKKITETAEEMSNSDFKAKPGRPFPCDFCAYKLICDAWK